MSVSAKFKSDYHIQQRRDLEFKEGQLHNLIKGDKNSFLKANWEHKTDNIIKKNIIRDRVADMRKRKASDLMSRRAKLAAILAYED